MNRIIRFLLLFGQVSQITAVTFEQSTDAPSGHLNTLPSYQNERELGRALTGNPQNFFDLIECYNGEQTAPEEVLTHNFELLEAWATTNMSAYCDLWNHKIRNDDNYHSLINLISSLAQAGRNTSQIAQSCQNLFNIYYQKSKKVHSTPITSPFTSAPETEKFCLEIANRYGNPYFGELYNDGISYSGPFYDIDILLNLRKMCPELFLNVLEKIASRQIVLPTNSRLSIILPNLFQDTYLGTPINFQSWLDQQVNAKYFRAILFEYLNAHNIEILDSKAFKYLGQKYPDYAHVVILGMLESQPEVFKYLSQHYSQLTYQTLNKNFQLFWEFLLQDEDHNRLLYWMTNYPALFCKLHQTNTECRTAFAELDGDTTHAILANNPELARNLYPSKYNRQGANQNKWQSNRKSLSRYRQRVARKPTSMRTKRNRQT